MEKRKLILTEDFDSDDIKMKELCCICHQPIEGYGNNAEPVCAGRCCDKCNYEVVIPERIAQIKKSANKEEALKEADEMPELEKEEEVEEIPAEEQPAEAPGDLDMAISSMLGDAIIRTWEAIDNLNSIMISVKAEAEDHPLIPIIQSIVDDEMMHVGQLEESMKYVNPSSQNIDQGKAELEIPEEEIAVEETEEVEESLSKKKVI